MDVRVETVQAWRSVSARPAATLATVLVLSLGIGLVAAVFALADPFLLRPLPYENPSELVLIRLSRQAMTDDDWWAREEPSGPQLADWQARRDLFSAVGAFRQTGAGLRVRLRSALVLIDPVETSRGFLDVLGGRFRGLSGAGADPSVLPLVLTNAAAARLGEDVSHRVLNCVGGSSVLLNGMLPEDFVFPAPWIGRALDGLVERDVGALTEGRRDHSPPFTVVGRLQPGVTPAAASAALTAGLPSGARLLVDVRPLPSEMTRRVRPVALGAVAASVLVLLVCIGNVGNLFLARSLYRSREFATRAALGASTLDLARLVSIELAGLTMAGIAGGLWLAGQALAICRLIMPAQYSAIGDPAINMRVVLVAVLAGVLVVIGGLGPAWAGWRAGATPLAPHLSTGESRATRALRFLITAGQSCFAAVLLLGASLLARSYVNLVVQDSGLSGDAVVVVVSYSSQYPGARIREEIETTLERLRLVPGVRAVGGLGGSLLNGLVSMGPVPVGRRTVAAALKWVTPGYFEATGSTIIRGRPLTKGDGRGTAVVVNQAFAKLAWGTVEAVGRLAGTVEEPWQVVGVIRDTFDVALDQTPLPAVYFPVDHMPENMPHITYVLQGTPDSSAVSAIRTAVREVDADAVILDSRSIDERLSASIKRRTFAALSLGFFAAAALGVCLAGLAGLVAFVVARRTRDIAICLALGATSRDVLRLALGPAILATLSGIAVGLLIGRWLSQVLGSLLYGIQPGDWGTVGASAMFVLIVAFLAAVVPARHALGLSPTVALRVE